MALQKKKGIEIHFDTY